MEPHVCGLYESRRRPNSSAALLYKTLVLDLIYHDYKEGIETCGGDDVVVRRQSKINARDEIRQKS